MTDSKIEADISKLLQEFSRLDYWQLEAATETSQEKCCNCALLSLKMKHCIQTGFGNFYINCTWVGKHVCNFIELHKYNFQYRP